jgi:hypothetical protein
MATVPARRWNAWGVAVLWSAALACAIWVAWFTVDQILAIGIERADGSTLSIVAIAGAMVAYASLGALVVRRRPGHRVGWLLLLIALSVLATFVGFGAGSALAADRGVDDVLAGLVMWVAVVLFGPAIVLLVGVLPILFPDGRLPGPRWRLPVGLVVVAVAAGSACFAIAPGQLDPGLAANPFGIPAAPSSLPMIGAILDTLAIVAGGLLGILSMAIRFRRSRGGERQQMKWMLAAVAVVVSLVIPSQIGVDFGLLSVGSAAALALIPIAVAVAILRHGLYEIDRIVSRTISYALVIGALAVLFGALVLALESLLADVTRAETVPVAVSTLIAVALFQPLRARVRDAVDRRFDRTRYDASRTVERFGDRLRDEIDGDRIADDTLATVAATLAPTSARIWLRDRAADRGDLGPP